MTDSQAMGSTRKAAGQAILELADEGHDVVAVSADTSKSMFTTLLGEKYPERFYDVGIAEQNMMMVSAGLASTGKTAFAASYSVFTSMRCCEQLRTFIAYPRLNVKVIAGIGGLSAGIEGVTHVATEDLGIVRCIAGMTVIAPSDATTTKMAVKAAAHHEGPVYIRVGRDPSPTMFDENYRFEIGMPVMHKDGSDVTLIACGLVLYETLQAADVLADMGISVSVIEVHTLQPLLGEEIIKENIRKTKKVITIEEHNIVGGLATVISEILVDTEAVVFEKIGLFNCFAESGTPDSLRVRYGLDAKSIVEKVNTLLNKKQN